jgi:hypothetical protein
MTTMSELRAGIAANLATVSGLRAYAYVPDDPRPPVAYVIPTGIDFDTAMGRGADTYSFTVKVIVGRWNERTAQTTLDGYCDPSSATSIKRAIQSDRQLGGQAFDLRVESLRNYGPIILDDGVTYLSAEFAVTVIAQ